MILSRHGFGRVLILVLFGLLPQIGSGQTSVDGIERIRQSLMLLLPNVEPTSITETPMANIYEVVIGSRLVYISGDGRFLIEGEVIDLEQQQNLTTPRLREVTLSAIERVGEANMLIFEPAEKVKHTLTVFTDIDSAYSRKLQREIETYTHRGIRIRYLFFPRAGVDSPSYMKAVTVWCSVDRQKALKQAMSGEAKEMRDCENPVSNHFQLGTMLGVSGAPVLVLENGEMLPGYVDAEKLYEIMSKMKPFFEKQ
ncbi:MAG: thioredoxin fold domain-containing protein [Sedimenticola sp.]|nr:thioredoxin fold domain-containing protein [Sedimenticola sp.]